MTSGAYGGYKVDTRLGVTHPGTVENFHAGDRRDVVNPSPNDWLMYRGNPPAGATASSARSTPAMSVSFSSNGRWG